MEWPFVDKRCKKVWKAAPLYIFWIVWKEMNQRSFDNEEHPDHFLRSSFLSILFFWVKVYIETGFVPLFDFVEWLGPC